MLAETKGTTAVPCGRWGLGLGACCLIVGALSGQEPGSVKKTRKIGATAGDMTGPLRNEDRFGAALLRPGDFDGDGIADLVVGAPQDDAGATDAGALWLLLLEDEGTVRSERHIGSGLGGFGGTLGAFDRFGSSLASIGDLDGDGIAELAVGAPGANLGGTDRGAVWILWLRADGSVRDERVLGSGAAGFGGDLAHGDGFGSALAALGDLDGDGLCELAVGAPGDDTQGQDRGALWILSLGLDGSVLAEQRIAQGLGGFGASLGNLDQFGGALATVGDLDGDGIPDLAVGAPGSDLGGAERGAVWVLRLAPDGTVRGSTVLDSSQVSGLGNGDRFGSALAAVGDLDADGSSELAVGATLDDDGALNLGAVWLLGLDPGGNAVSQRKVSATQGDFGGTLARNDAFGGALASLGDLDGDGRIDLAVGAGGDDEGGTDRGAVWVLFLNAEPSGALVPRSGAGGNAPLLSATLAPRAGEVWEVQVDCRGHRPGLLWHLAVDQPSSGYFVQAGEYLIDTTLPRRLRALASHDGRIHTFRHRIPTDPALAGRWIYTQAAVTGAPGARLSNALDALIGP